MLVLFVGYEEKEKKAERDNAHDMILMMSKNLSPPSFQKSYPLFIFFIHGYCFKIISLQNLPAKKRRNIKMVKFHFIFLEEKRQRYTNK